MFSDEAARIAYIARADPSFRAVSVDRLNESEARLATSSSADEFRIEAHRLMALGRNAHSRAIANRRAQVSPVRFVWLADGPCVAEGPQVGSGLTAINGVSIEAVFRSVRPLLAGTDQRARALAGFMFAWPAAISMATGGAGPVCYRLKTVSGEFQELVCKHTIAAGSIYPVRETGPAEHLLAADGIADRASACSGIFHRVLRPRLMYVRIGDLSIEQDDLGGRLERISAALHSSRQIIVDLRGNPGGSFLSAVKFVRLLPEAAPGSNVAVLVDKYTFSAALVTAALLKVHAGARIIGEEMGDAERFYAEGGMETLPRSDIDIRYSDGWHDWATGHADPFLTPPLIAREMVGAGSLLPDFFVSPMGRDLKAGRDVALHYAIALVSG